jgi:O-antigen ligase
MSPGNTFATSSPDRHTRRRDVALWGIVSTEILILCVPPLWWGYAALFLCAIAALSCMVVFVLQGEGNRILLVWLLVYPLGAYFLSYPREGGAIITLDRVIVGLLVVTAFFANRQTHIPVSPELRKTGWWWFAFLVAAGITIPRVSIPLHSLTVLVDAFVLPLILGWFVLHHFDVLRNLKALHTVTCVLALYVAAIGAAEVVLQRDLLALPDAGILIAGDYMEKASATQLVIRPNGPFSTTNSYALVGMVLFFFLLFLKQALGEMPRWRAILHRLAVVAALATTFMPLFRSVMASLVVILLVDAYYQHGRRRVVRVALVASFGVLFLAVRLALPAVFEERSNPVNFYGRVAVQMQALAMFADHPINGVGLGNFGAMALTSDRYSATFEDTQSVDAPHNNFGEVLTETGLLGFLPYVAAQVYLLLAFVRIRKQSTSAAKLVWKFFLFLFLGYSINGLSLASGFYGDLNLPFVLVLMILYKYAVQSTLQFQVASA